MVVDCAHGGRLRKLSAKEAWKTIEDLALYEEEEWYDPIFPKRGSLDYENTNTEQLLRIGEEKREERIFARGEEY
ncbi:hypothetical protein Tco_0872678 [Tanacetum coccineum]